MMHTDLTTIRLTGSHKYYGITRSCREILECKGMTDLIPTVKAMTVKFQSTAVTGGPVDDTLAAEVQALKTKVTHLEDTVAMLSKQVAALAVGDAGNPKPRPRIKKRWSLFK